MDINDINIEFRVISSNEKDKCSSFDCGFPSIDLYIKNKAFVDINELNIQQGVNVTKQD